MNNQKHLTHQQIIGMLISPRSALDRLLATGTIDFNDNGSLQCCYVLASQIDKFSGVECPDIAPMVKLCAGIESGAVDENDIHSCKMWVNDYAAYLKKVPFKYVQKAVNDTNALVHGA